MDWAIAASLALFPLLPAGPTYLGLEWPWALEAFFLAFAAAGLLILLTDRNGPHPIGSDRTSHSVRLLRRGYVIWLIPVAAAALLGLLDRTPFDAVLVRVEADGLLGRLAYPMNQAVDAVYPLRVGLTCLEGGLMFWLLSLLLTRTSQPARRVRLVTRGALWGLALVSVIAMVQYVTRAHLHEYWVRANPDLPRSHATLDDPNALASFLVLGIGLAIGVAWSAETGRRPVGALLATALALAALVTTVSRAGWGGLMIAGLACAALLPDALVDRGSTGRLLRRAARGVGAVLVVAMLLWTVAAVALPKHQMSVAPTTPWEAVRQTVDPREPLEAILKRRHLLWLAGVDLVREHWVLGAGLGQFPRFLASYPGADGPENAHNFFLQVLAETGVIGLAALTAFLGAMALAVWPPSAELRLRRLRLAIGVSWGLLAFVLTWLTGHPLLNLSNQLWLASVLAVGVAALGAIDEAAPAAHGPRATPALPPTGSWLLHRAWVPAVAAITVAAAVPRVSAAVNERAPLRSHTAGVYDWESAPGREGASPNHRFRWTRGRAALREPMRGAVLTMPLYLARSLPVTLHATVGGVAVEPVTLTSNGWHTVTYDLVALLGEQRWRSMPTITVDFRVSPSFIPAAGGLSADTRELGVGLGVVGWSQSDSVSPGRD